MLILQRLVGESLVIGDDIKAVILSADGNQVSIGVRAPKNVAVHREEVYRRIQLERREKRRALLRN